MDRNRRAPSPQDQRRDAALASLAVLALATLGGIAANPRDAATPLPAEIRARRGIDPNSAEWFELSQLPGIGETMARRIVAHRDAAHHANRARSAFSRPADLANVRGIGDKTVRRLAPFLCFDEAGERERPPTVSAARDDPRSLAAD